MEKSITATEVVRKFSEILNSVRYKGDRYTVVRGGKPVAFIYPVEKPVKERTLGELKALIKNIPSLGSDSESFRHDIGEIMKLQPVMPEVDKWV